MGMRLFKKAQDLFRRRSSLQGLGLIPDWQFSADPKVNPFVNEHVSMPPGMLQAGAWYAQPPYGPQTAIGPNSGLAGTELRCLNCAGPFRGQLGYVMIDEAPPGLGFVESFWWQHKRAIVLTALAAAGAAVIGGLAVLK